MLSWQPILTIFNIKKSAPSTNPKIKLKQNAEDIYLDTLSIKCSFYHLTPACRSSVKKPLLVNSKSST